MAFALPAAAMESLVSTKIAAQSASTNMSVSTKFVMKGGEVYRRD